MLMYNSWCDSGSWAGLTTKNVLQPRLEGVLHSHQCHFWCPSGEFLPGIISVLSKIIHCTSKRRVDGSLDETLRPAKFLLPPSSFRLPLQISAALPTFLPPCQIFEMRNKYKQPRSNGQDNLRHNMLSAQCPESAFLTASPTTDHYHSAALFFSCKSL